jgi:dihydroorotase
MSTSTYLIRNAKIVNEGVVFEGDILIENEFIKEIAEKISVKSSDCVIIDAEGIVRSVPGVGNWRETMDKLLGN